MGVVGKCDLAEPAADEEFQRAKNQLKSMVFMNLESRSIYCEEIGQQMLSYGHHKPPEEWAREIDALTKQDLMQAVAETLQSPICYSVFGKDVDKELNNLPPVDGITSYLKMLYKGCLVCCHQNCLHVRFVIGLVPCPTVRAVI